MATDQFSSSEREQLADKKEALPNGSYPIRNRKDLKDAIQAYGRAKNQEEVKSWIMRRAKEMGFTEDVPSEWLEKSLNPNGNADKVTVDGVEKPSLEEKPPQHDTPIPVSKGLLTLMELDMKNHGMVGDPKAEINNNMPSKIMGHTKSGKDICFNSSDNCTDFTAQDHSDAGKLHHGYEIFYSGKVDAGNDDNYTDLMLHHKLESDKHHTKQYGMEKEEMDQ